MLKSAWRFRRFLRPYSSPLIVGALLVVIQTAATLAEPWPLMIIIDGAIGQKPQHGWFARAVTGGISEPETILIRALGAWALFVGFSALLGFVSDYRMNSAGQRMMMTIRNAVFWHVQRLSLSYHDRQRVGDLVSRITTDIDRLQNMLIAVFDTLIPSVVMLIGLALLMLLVDLWFGMLALTIAPDRKSTRLNSSHIQKSRMPSSA